MERPEPLIFYSWKDLSGELSLDWFEIYITGVRSSAWHLLLLLRLGDSGSSGEVYCVFTSDLSFSGSSEVLLSLPSILASN